ncbi:beta-ketoacyl synthase [Picrophilus oshimae DSM 9789]|uniref:Beta-ketoacyl synthase n=1 Tax=Picrophilus torridus (strain ATCC 700027 / DSM 9790 / JCM 10055 / NBRC 100828 / KAW 2/3) TaxID=1122961 RepID=Q6L234_PICTO|nr:beta-ketoacyl synthase [Picrophilus oshimae DSM 9789]
MLFIQNSERYLFLVITLSDVYIIGAGETKFGELWDKSLRNLAVEAGLKAIENAGIYSKDIDIIYGANGLAGVINKQENIGALIADFSGLSEEGIPAIRIEASTASGAAAVHEAYLAIKSGEYNVAVVGGVEKMTDIHGHEINEVMSSILDREWESFYGATPASMAALIARKYMKDFNIEKEALSMISVNDHENASRNPDAQYRNKISLKQAMESVMVADPLTLMDCSPISDGAAAIVLASEDFVKRNKKDGVKILASAIAEDYLDVGSRKSIYTFNSTKKAARLAFDRAGIKSDDVSFAEIHDSFSIYGLLALEDLGFADKGNAKDLVYDEIKLSGRIPLNPSGGLKAKGDPYGAVGVGQFVEAYLQLMEKAGDRQVKSPRYGLLHNMAGTGATSVVHILGD